MFTIAEILKATSGKLINPTPVKARIAGISIDSRSIKPGELFIAIRGSRFNGHDFIKEARRKRAGAILFSCSRFAAKSGVLSRGIPMIKVENTLEALACLAHYHRAKFRLPVVAITGTNGKTTTKEMLKAILNKSFNLLSNPGTQNNLIGVSLAVLALRKKHNLAILELGTNHPGEIEKLSWITRPGLAIITNIGPAHLKFFKNLQGVFRAKSELIKNLTKQARLIINQDDKFLSGLNSPNLRKVTFGLSRLSNFWAEDIVQTQQGTSFLLNRSQRIVLKTLGRHNVYNALAAIACARFFAASFKEIRKALAAFRAPSMRMQISSINGIKIINDCYNANPHSLACALDFLRQLPAKGKKIVVCGDMLELGRAAARLHLDSGREAAKNKIDFLITVGPLAEGIASGAYSAGMPRGVIQSFADCAAAGESLRRLARPGDIILVKGSRAMKMENTIECFTGCFTR